MAYNNKGAADFYIQALLNAGYRETRKPREAAFLLYDHERRDRLIDAFDGKPVFITPHTPYSWFFWDGICPIHRTTVNFVCGEAAKKGLQSFNYPHWVEVCGFSRCHVKKFTPTDGSKLLFSPAHPLVVDKKFPRPEDTERHVRALEWCIENKREFQSVTVRHYLSLDDNGFGKYKNEPGIKFEQVEKLSADLSVEAIDSADLVLSCNTFGFISTARGKPTLLYGYKGVMPNSRSGYVKNYDLYKHIWEPPYYFEDLTIQEALGFCESESDAVANWKAEHIGGNFNEDKFISIVREFV